MTRLFKTAIVLACVLGMVGSASAIQWTTDQSYRSITMGGIKHALEDEVSSLTLFNHQNLAGMAFLPAKNRIDGALSYTSDVTDVPDYMKSTTTSMELVRPNSQFQGLQYWLDKGLVMELGVQGMLITAANKSAAPGAEEEKLNFSGLGGGGALAYKTDFGLAIGGGISYTGAGGKPGSLTGAYNVFADAGGTTSKLELAANNVNWGIGLGYQLEKLGGDNTLSLGVEYGTDDDRPNLAGMSNISDPSAIAMNLGDYNGVMTIEGTANLGLGDTTVTRKLTVTNLISKFGGEVIFNMGKMLEAGIYIDSKTKDTKTKSEDTAYGTTNTTPEDKVQSTTMMGITPEVRGTFDLGGVSLLPAVFFSTFGSGSTTPYAGGVAGTKVNSGSTAFGGALGVQALNKALQAGFQFDGGTYTPNTDHSDYNTAITRIGVGAEYWVIPMLAVRAGYNTLTYTNKAPSATDQKSITSTISFGVGADIPGLGMTDLLVKLDSFTRDPKPTGDNSTHNATGVFLAQKMVF